MSGQQVPGDGTDTVDGEARDDDGGKALPDEGVQDSSRGLTLVDVGRRVVGRGAATLGRHGKKILLTLN